MNIRLVTIPESFRVAHKFRRLSTNKACYQMCSPIPTKWNNTASIHLEICACIFKGFTKQFWISTKNGEDCWIANNRQNPKCRPYVWMHERMLPIFNCGTTHSWGYSPILSRTTASKILLCVGDFYQKISSLTFRRKEGIE